LQALLIFLLHSFLPMAFPPKIIHWQQQQQQRRGWPFQNRQPVTFVSLVEQLHPFELRLRLMLMLEPIGELINQLLQLELRQQHQLELQLLGLDLIILRPLLQLKLMPQSELAQQLIIKMLERVFAQVRRWQRLLKLLVELQLLGLELKLELQPKLILEPFLQVIIGLLDHHLLLEPKPMQRPQLLG
jgi:hypothetical protein